MAWYLVKLSVIFSHSGRFIRGEGISLYPLGWSPEPGLDVEAKRIPLFAGNRFPNVQSAASHMERNDTALTQTQILVFHPVASCLLVHIKVGT